MMMIDYWKRALNLKVKMNKNKVMTGYQQQILHQIPEAQLDFFSRVSEDRLYVTDSRYRQYNVD